MLIFFRCVLYPIVVLELRLEQFFPLARTVLESCKNVSRLRFPWLIVLPAARRPANTDLAAERIPGSTDRQVSSAVCMVHVIRLATCVRVVVDTPWLPEHPTQQFICLRFPSLRNTVCLQSPVGFGGVCFRRVFAHHVYLVYDTTYVRYVLSSRSSR